MKVLNHLCEIQKGTDLPYHITVWEISTRILLYLLNESKK